MGYIYYIKNLSNNKYYIGQTINNIKERWLQHKRKNSNCRYLKYAFNKYGFDNFKFKLICICFDKDLDRFEIEYIKKYNSLVPNGYNLKQGGLNGGKHHQETKNKISKSLQGRKMVYINGINPHIGKIHSYETKLKISNSLTGRKLSNEHITNIIKGNKVNIKKVIQYDLNNNIINIFKNCIEAAIKNNTTNAGISMVCNNKRIQLKGYKYKYENQIMRDLLNDISNLKKL